VPAQLAPCTWGGYLWQKKDLQILPIPAILTFMMANHPICPSHKAVLGLSALLLRRLPPRLTTQDVAAGKAQ